MPHRRHSNIFSLIYNRETCGKTPYHSNRKLPAGYSPKGLQQWLEADLLRCCSAQYCELSSNSRSTIAADFCCDGSLIASTHGDHTVKIISSISGKCVRVLRGHRRTPWVVRFHPRRPTILASGSLDNEVRIWDVSSGECLSATDFGRPIASLAFSCDGLQLAVASGHKLYLWQYTLEPQAEPPLPVTVLKTRRSLRAVQFHSLASGLMLTAELHEANLLTDNLPPASIALHPHRPRATGGPETSWSHRTPLTGITPTSTPSAPSSSTAAPTCTSCGSSPPAPTTNAPFAGFLTSRSTPSGTPPTAPGPALPSSTSGSTTSSTLGSSDSSASSSSMAITNAGGSASGRSTRSALAQSFARPATGSSAGVSSSNPFAAAPPPSLPQPLDLASPPSTPATLSTTPSSCLVPHLSDLTLHPSPSTSQLPRPPALLDLPTTPSFQGWRTTPAGSSAPGAAARTTSTPNMTINHPPPHPTMLGITHRSPPVAIRPPLSPPVPPSALSTSHDIIYPPSRAPTAFPSRPPLASRDLSRSLDSGTHLPALYRPWFTNSPKHHHGPAIPPPHETIHAVNFSTSPHHRHHATWAVGTSPPVHAPAPFLQAPPTLEPPTHSLLHPSTPSQPTNFPSHPAPLPHAHPGLSRLQPPPSTSNPRAPPPSYPPPPYHLSSSLPLAHPLIPLGCDFPWPWEVHSNPPANPHPSSPPSTPPAATVMLSQDQPSISKLRLFRIDPSHPKRLSDPPLLTISHAVLCSEMGTHLSPCGRYLAAVVACSETPRPTPRGPTPHPPPPLVRNIIYELRVYSLAPATFGQVHRSRPIKAAQCLTSLQFSPTSDHLLLAYGRRHLSLCSLVADGHSVTPVHTVIDIYRVADMSLVRVLPSAEDEVNVAAFHPVPGEGVVYGTKEGRLRILRHDRTPPSIPQANMGGSNKMGVELDDDDLYESSSEGEGSEGDEVVGGGFWGL